MLLIVFSDERNVDMAELTDELNELKHTVQKLKTEVINSIDIGLD